MRVLNATLGAYYYGFSLGCLTLMLPTLDKVLNITGDNENLLNGIATSTLAIGAMAGNLIAPSFLKYGRRKLMILKN